MTYDLAKQLKDAGFPWKEPSCSPGIAYIPTLSELIEACGGSLDLMMRPGANIASKLHAEEFELVKARGSTPEEAVANLWLVLNKK